MVSRAKSVSHLGNGALCVVAANCDFTGSTVASATQDSPYTYVLSFANRCAVGNFATAPSKPDNATPWLSFRASNGQDSPSIAQEPPQHSPERWTSMLAGMDTLSMPIRGATTARKVRCTSRSSFIGRRRRNTAATPPEVRARCHPHTNPTVHIGAYIATLGTS